MIARRQCTSRSQCVAVVHVRRPRIHQQGVAPAVRRLARKTRRRNLAGAHALRVASTATAQSDRTTAKDPPLPADRPGTANSAVLHPRLRTNPASRHGPGRSRRAGWLVTCTAAVPRRRSSRQFMVRPSPNRSVEKLDSIAPNSIWSRNLGLRPPPDQLSRRCAKPSNSCRCRLSQTQPWRGLQRETSLDVLHLLAHLLDGHLHLHRDIGQLQGR